MRNIIEWTGIIGGLALAYPLVKSGGLLDQALGGWWLLGAVLLLGLTCAAGRLWGIWAARRTCPPSGAAVTRDEARQEALTVPAGQTVH